MEDLVTDSYHNIAGTQPGTPTPQWVAAYANGGLTEWMGYMATGVRTNVSDRTGIMRMLFDDLDKLGEDRWSVWKMLGGASYSAADYLGNGMNRVWDLIGSRYEANALDPGVTLEILDAMWEEMTPGGRKWMRANLMHQLGGIAKSNGELQMLIEDDQVLENLVIWQRFGFSPITQGEHYDLMAAEMDIAKEVKTRSDQVLIGYMRYLESLDPSLSREDLMKSKPYQEYKAWKHYFLDADNEALNDKVMQSFLTKLQKKPKSTDMLVRIAAAAQIEPDLKTEMSNLTTRKGNK
jgi:hypothetical protein